MDIQTKLFEFKDEKYADFTYKITPNVDRNSIIGVRVPNIKKIAKYIVGEEQQNDFLNDLPHKYFEENQLHSAILSLYKDYDRSILLVDQFLPYVDNWAVCDGLRPKSFNSNKDRLLIKIPLWIESNNPFTVRFGIKMLMDLYLDVDFNEKYLCMVKEIKSDDYYVKMMIAWYFATALSKQWYKSIIVLENKELDKWCHNKTIQKAIESYRITLEQKEYLRTLKI